MTKVFDNQKRGVQEAFKYNGITFNGLDYEESLRSLNTTMEKTCRNAGGYFIDMASKKFDSSDFYDGVHMTPTGAQKVGKYLFDEFIIQKLY
jgi:hypothetical protein